ncbi:cytochrome c biogenesis CcdA family protein [Pseudooceanicola atlanticus]|jgi:cytochrome c-type biogenesis protein|uniref:Sulfur oxidation protein n=1 Tax=Pseudooceanicola atlanticus TaxID=1461694 RepID=A0A0A0EEL8_9RHOB|nr:cytochrome c biogenesis protein CcdA [Pseudooceanicola atlanticus]KGM49371.1 sulfur oxidation protein [Pseudooceanicola atlanticus]
MLDVTFLGALVAGLLSFVSPCILPMVPFYLSYLAGTGVNQLAEDGGVPAAVKRRAVLASVLFALGVITVFVGLGATATVFGQLVRQWFDVLRWVAAGIIFVMGLHFLGVLRIGLLFREFRADADVRNTSLVGAYVIGLAFAFGWTPCVGPVLATILFTAAGADTAARGALLLMSYGIGMTAPFILAALFVGPFMRWMQKFRRHLGLVEKAMGVLLILFAVLIATNSVNYIAQWMLDHVPWFASVG